MKSSVYQMVSEDAETVVELASIDRWAENDIYLPCMFSVEVVGNDAEVNVTAKGPFDSSAVVDIADGTFPIGGSIKTISSAALSQLIFTRAGVTPYNINIIRSPVN